MGNLNLLHFREVLQIVVGLLEHGPGSGRAVHIADIAFADHRVENGGRTAVADAEMTLEERCRTAFRGNNAF